MSQKKIAESKTTVTTGFESWRNLPINHPILYVGMCSFLEGTFRKS